jgi:exonuclease III
MGERTLIDLVSLCFSLRSIGFKMEIRGVSWNVNGTRKFIANLAVVAFLSAFTVIFLQETFETESQPPTEHLFLRGFTERHVYATRGPRGRGSGGLKTFIDSRQFGSGSIRRIPAVHDTCLAVRWRPEAHDSGVLFLNVYVPRHDPSGINLSYS